MWFKSTQPALNTVQLLAHSQPAPVGWEEEKATKVSRVKTKDREGSLASYGHRQKTPQLGETKSN